MWFDFFRKSKNKLCPSARRRIVQEDLIKALYACQGLPQSKSELIDLANDLGLSYIEIREAIGQLALDGDLLVNPYKLTEQGEERALRLIRLHRLYELYLAEHSGYKAEEWHSRADQMEHKLSEAEAQELERLLGYPLYDPHGDPIPNSGLELPHLPISEMREIKPDKVFKILHIEDDDIELFRTINKMGLARHSLIEIKNVSSAELTFIYEGEVYSLPIEALEALSLVEANEEDLRGLYGHKIKRLSRLSEGETARIVALSPSCRGAMRRRLMDLGFVKGSLVEIDMHSPLSNPIAYVIRGATIALREEQARYILVEQEKPKNLNNNEE